MPLPGFLTTDSGSLGNRFKQPLLSGSIADGGSSGGPVAPIGGLIMVQPVAAITSSGASSPILNQVVSTAAAAIGAASFVYIPQTTGAIATSSFAAAASAPNYTSVGAALIWDAGNSRLGIYSTAGGSGTWFFSVQTSIAAKSFTSS